MFGRSLAETVKFEARRGGGYVPLIVSKCVNFIKTNGKKKVGSRVEKLKLQKVLMSFVDRRRGNTSLVLVWKE